ncbi:uncharacterized protein si:ch211-51h4.2 isoform X1 [Coregonus clupeaformis]|uniref:uncharacterized protein si:ch211-51h4.2 isoform X1 n=1 Tax=Coregonus clupeaformis TaxID=59861 RepID=UPI001BE0436E|nr:uncharacterized protein si:ch211-51h4.2 isoform X1 [Coregonus clupeaformis]
MMATAAEEICQSPCPISERHVTTMSIKITRKNQDKPWKLRLIYLQCYFMSIATILGTGILGLPVTIAHAGLMPFLVSFIIGFFVQALLIYLFVDLLQRCQVVQIESLKTTETERILMQDVGLEEPALTNTEEAEEEEGEEGEEADTGLLQQDADRQTLEEKLQPNLHVLGLLFLSKPMSHAFNFILLFQFVSIGISYVLAGSEAYAALLHVSHIYVIPGFTWTLSLGILLAQMVIQPITSLLTLLKGIMLIITVAVTFAVGSEVQQETTNDFSQIGKPFLMGTVALGGIVNVMPLLFSEISHNKTQIMWFRRVILGGLATCTVLNILWCWAVLEIVPQMSVQRVMEEGVVNTTSGVISESSPTAYSMVYSNISLEESEKAGEIATIPLTKIISLKYHHYSWVAELIHIFIAISITVSFLVMGSAMKHTIDGLVNSHWNTKLESMSKVWERTLPQSFHRCSSRGLANGLISLLAFGIIFIVSSCDPRGFVVMLDKVVSFSLNTEVGLFIFVMLRASRSERFQHLTVPLPVGQRVFQLHWTLPVYFLFAVAYDVIQSIVEIAEHNLQHSSQPLLANSSLS